MVICQKIIEVNYYQKNNLIGYKDASEYWLAAYETENIEDQFEELWQIILPLYEQLHAYVRRCVSLPKV